MWNQCGSSCAKQIKQEPTCKNITPQCYQWSKTPKRNLLLLQCKYTFSWLIFLRAYLCLHWDRVRWENWSVHNFGPGSWPTWGWLLCESPWRKRAEGCSPPRESSYGAPHQPPGTNIAHRQRKALYFKKQSHCGKQSEHLELTVSAPSVCSPVYVLSSCRKRTDKDLYGDKVINW